jgi:coenzyme F420-reducing hydrogenase delta subunit
LSADRHHIKHKLRASSGFDAFNPILDGFILKRDRFRLQRSSAPDGQRFAGAIPEIAASQRGRSSPNRTQL